MALPSPFHSLQSYCPTRSTHAGWSVKALLTKPKLTLLGGRTTCQAIGIGTTCRTVGICSYLSCGVKHWPYDYRVCLLKQSNQEIDLLRSTEIVILYLFVEYRWCPLGKTNECILFNVFKTFLFVAVLLTGLTCMQADTTFGG